MLHMNENSPVKENPLKRHAFEELGNTPKKMLKTDENNKMSKVRVALFQDKDCGTKLTNMSLSTKSFYNRAERKKDDYKIIVRQRLKRRSKSCIPHFKRHTIGGINAGVSHGIKKPKLKSPKLSLDVRKDKSGTKKIISEIEETENVEPTDSSSSPEIDPNKRFFKIKRNSKALVTINKNVKLKVAPDGKIALNQKVVRHRKPKLATISFDASDLTVDEPELEATIEKTKVDNILKLLEDDWGDDDYDTMDLLDKGRHITPLKPIAVFNDVTVSPASELSNMTSNLDIKDISAATASEDILLDSNEKDCQNSSEPKYFPLFIKGYSTNKFDDIDKKNSGKENQNWQLSVKLNGGDNQYLLDAGQKNFGATQCTECGVVYQIGDPEDENAHLNYHNNKKSLKFSGWKTERVIMEDPFTMSRVILVEPTDSKLSWKKVEEILAYVDRDLGLADTKFTDYKQKRIFLYIRDKAVIGVLVAEHITTAHHMIPELLDLNCCTEENSPAKCGVNIIWTEINHRKQGIATKLMDILRTSFYFGYVMTLEDIAFSIPTPSGKIFAEKYTKTRNFKVYD